MGIPDRRTVKRLLATHRPQELPDEELTGAVLVTFTAADEPTLLLTRRSKRVANFPGEVSFPGGRREPSDATLRATALREAEEEIALSKEFVDMAGQLDDRWMYRVHKIRPFVGWIHAGAPLRPDPSEVESLLEMPLARFLDPKVHESRRLVASVETPERVVHYFHLDGATVWGATGRVVADLLGIVAGWKPTKPAHAVASPEALRLDI